jgi:hypothetical protein
LRDNAPGSCSGESPEDNLKINESHWLVAAEKFSELLTPITALLKQPQLAVEEASVPYCARRSKSARCLARCSLTRDLQAGLMRGDLAKSARRASVYMNSRLS